PRGVRDRAGTPPRRVPRLRRRPRPPPGGGGGRQAGAAQAAREGGRRGPGLRLGIDEDGDGLAPPHVRAAASRASSSLKSTSRLSRPSRRYHSKVWASPEVSV